jgi:hypothetical protein
MSELLTLLRKRIPGFHKSRDTLIGGYSTTFLSIDGLDKRRAGGDS